MAHCRAKCLPLHVLLQLLLRRLQPLQLQLHMVDQTLLLPLQPLPRPPSSSTIKCSSSCCRKAAMTAQLLCIPPSHRRLQSRQPMLVWPVR